MAKVILLGVMFLLSQAVAQVTALKPLQYERQQLFEKQKPQLKALQQERKVLSEKVIKMRSDRIRKKPIPQGTIATH